MVPSSMVVDASTGTPESFVRQWPMASKFSSARPGGSRTRWHDAHVALARCCSNNWRTDSCAVPAWFSFNGGTFGGGVRRRSP